MKLSAFNTAQHYMQYEHNEHDWVGNGPGVDAMGEATLRDALEHITGCCECVLDNWDDADWPDPELPDNYDWLPATQDCDLLEYVEDMILYRKGKDHPWLEELEKYMTLATIAKETA
jgi:hypothetical protein